MGGEASSELGFLVEFVFITASLAASVNQLFISGVPIVESPR